MKILILRYSSIGDIVLTTPVVRCLRKKYPDAEIHYATKKAFQPIVKHNPYLTKIHLLEESFTAHVNELKEEKFDYVIDLHNNQRTLILKLLLGVKSYSFDKLNFEKWLMVNFKINRLPDKHIVDRYIETCKQLGVENDGEGLDYFIAKEDEVDIETLPAGFHKGYVAWVIGAKQNTKKFPEDKIVSGISKAGYWPVLLLGGKEDAAAGEAILRQVGGNSLVFNAAGKFSLNQSASLVKQANMVITNDTGLMHIAAAYKRPVISIWGNTIPEFGMYPYLGKHPVPNVLYQVQGLPCRPCSKLGYDKCPQGHFKCMQLIPENEFGAVIEKKIGLGPKAV
ncbi:MAG TPA: glycosyltransferase family 9 protein [Chitinophagales bacterium]|nr:glycosyltransferase family 9 protein [Chitinophagales bacterium]